ncbi:MAG: hypothetical protein AAF497_23120, partial [Planctomycetota bacterium]
MATGTRDKTKVVGYEEYVDGQLTKVRSYIKLSDLAGLMMGLAAVVITYLIVVVILDHWVLKMTTWGRLACLVTLIVGVAVYIIAYVVPELMRKINPAYAAQMVERNEPSLRNSLINFVMLRPRRESVHEVVFEQVEEQAAKRLSKVQVDSAIDHSPLIRLACALLLSLVAFAGYAILSPKSPFQTLSRILQPFSDIAQPARVRLRDVQPGNTTVYAGRKVDVSVIAENTNEDDTVWLVYSSTDGQVANQRIPMQPDSSGFKYTGSLPSGDAGVQRDLEYRIEVGDAEAGPYTVAVSPAPSIFVEQIQYRFPAYTGKAAETINDRGDISAIEGTQVTIVARANQEIRSARVEFDPSEDGEAQLNVEKRRTMEHDGQTARVTFPLTLTQDGPTHSSYQLRFTSVDGITNDQPVEYPINVTPDLPPLVEILVPQKQRVQVPVNAKQLIEIRAVDPDYGLASVRLQAVRNRERIIDVQLLKDPGLGQRVLKYYFRPTKLELKPGDMVVYRAKAADNRTEPQNADEPAPNTEVTQNYAIEVVAPMEFDGREESGKNESGLSRDDGQSEGTGEGQEDGEGTKAGSESGADGDTEGEGADGESAEGMEGEGEGAEGADGEGEGAEGAEGEGADSEGAEGADGEGAESANG